MICDNIGLKIICETVKVNFETQQHFGLSLFTAKNTLTIKDFLNMLKLWMKIYLEILEVNHELPYSIQLLKCILIVHFPEL